MKATTIRTVAALTVVVVALVTAGCSDQAVNTESWSDGAAPVIGTPPPLPESTLPTSYLSDDPRAGIAVPAWYRIRIQGTVHENGGVVQFDLPAWLLVVHPYDEFGASGNDINIVDLGVATDRTPIEGVAGAIWYGTNPLVAQAMEIAVGLDDNSADVVTEWREDDVVYAELVPGASRWQFFNIYNVATGPTAQISNALTGTVSVRFAPDGETIAGRIDLAGTSGFNGPSNSTEYHAAVTGQRYTG